MAARGLAKGETSLSSVRDCSCFYESSSSSNPSRYSASVAARRASSKRPGIHKLSYQLSKLVGSFRPSRGPTLGSALGKPLLTTLLLQEAALGAHILFQRQHDKRLLSPWSVFVGGLHGGREVGRVRPVASDLLGGDVPK